MSAAPAHLAGTLLWLLACLAPSAPGQLAEPSSPVAVAPVLGAAQVAPTDEPASAEGRTDGAGDDAADDADDGAAPDPDVDAEAQGADAAGADASATATDPDGARPATVEELAAAGLELVVPAGPVPLGWIEVGVRGDLTDGATLALAEPPADTLVGAESNRPERFGGRRLTLRLGLMRSGTLVLGGLTLADAGRDWQLPDLTLEVSAPVAEDRPARVQPLMAPLALPMARRVLLSFYAAGVLGALLVGLYVVRATRTVVTPVFVVPADQQALEALARLREALPRRSDDVPGFVVAVSDVLRRYIEGRFDVHAPSRTTEEFLLEVVSAEGQLAERAATLEQFLTLCDLVKYARHRPAASEAGPLLDTAQTFVEETR